MADEIDISNDRIEHDLARAIERARRATTEAARPLPTECDNGCGAPPSERSRFCCADCRDDFAARETQQKRSGTK